MEIPRKFFVTAIALLCIFGIAGCGLGYYWQATTGHMAVMDKRRPVSEVIADPETSAVLRDKVTAASRAVDFAHDELLLPDNGSYQFYADIGRNYVVWNVFAAPEFSLTPLAWCFPVAGCVSYRGYFDKAQADDFATGLAGEGDDIFVAGITAYSTLGRFADPLLNTMMHLSDYRVAGLIFHELAHQHVYVKGDSMFNESFANFVEQEGTYRWLNSIGNTEALCEFSNSVNRRAEVQQLLLQSRRRLEAAYLQETESGEKRRAKREIFAALDQDYRKLRATWQTPPFFDGWFEAGLNNARLAALATYESYVPAFAVLLSRQNGDLIAFYRVVFDLASLDAEERTTAMDELLESALTGAEAYADSVSDLLADGKCSAD